jgi:hypothetical protein
MLEAVTGTVKTETGQNSDLNNLLVWVQWRERNGEQLVEQLVQRYCRKQTDLDRVPTLIHGRSAEKAHPRRSALLTGVGLLLPGAFVWRCAADHGAANHVIVDFSPAARHRKQVIRKLLPT